MKKIKIKQEFWDNGFQKWVKRLYLYGDKELKRLGDWSVGFYVCEKCNIFKGFAYKLPPETKPLTVLKEAKNDWVDFLHEHCHSDGRAVLFEKKMP